MSAGKSVRCAWICSLCWMVVDLNTFQYRIQLGAIFDMDDNDTKTGFLSAITLFNNRKEEAFQLSTVVDVTDISDSFNLATSICSHMEKGVFMLFGGRKFESSSIIEAYSQTFHVPYVSPGFADNVQRHLSTFQLHMKPSHTKALVDLIIHFGWRNYHYVYDSEEGLYRMQELVRTFEKKRYVVTVHMRRLQDIDNAHEDLRALDKQADDDKVPNKYILLDLSKESNYYKIMKQIREVGMNKHGYHYIMGTMDFLNLNMERYRYGGVNITGFQLVNYSSTFVQNFLKLWRGLDPNFFPGAGNDSIHIDAALAVDAIEVIQRTLSQLIENSSSIFKHTFRRGEVYNHNRTLGVPCDADPPVPWMHGEALTQGMKKLHFDGVTGNIEFDEYGFRKLYKFDVYNVGLNKGPNKIGEWSSRGGVYTDGEEFPKMNNTSTDRGYTIVTSTLPPQQTAEGSTRTVHHRHGHYSHRYGHRLETDDRIGEETMKGRLEDRMSFADTVRAINAELGKAGRQRGNITTFVFESSEKLANTTSSEKKSSETKEFNTKTNGTTLNAIKSIYNVPEVLFTSAVDLHFVAVNGCNKYVSKVTTILCLHIVLLRCV